MSLFGGDSSAPPTESGYESRSDDPPSSIEQSLRTTSLRSPPNAQFISAVNDVQDLIVEDAAQDLIGNDAEYNDEDPNRPNRCRGPLQTWKGYTAIDRQIAGSLQQLEDTDLAAHLYNAHALKRRVRKPITELSTLNNWQGKDTWLKQGKELDYIDASGQTQTELVPAKDWTAWPLPPPLLYTLGNGLRRAMVTPYVDEWVIGSKEVQDPGSDLKEEMLGLFLKMAKENWNAKDWEDGDQRCLRGKQSSTKLQSKRKQRSTDVEMKDGNEDNMKDAEAQVIHEGGSKRGRRPQIEVDIKPTILADDAKAQRLLRPTIVSMLSRLDNLMLAIQRTRLNHFGRGGFGEGSSQSEFTTDAETTGRESRSMSQSRNKSATRNRPLTRQFSRPSASRATRASNSPKPADPQVVSEDSDLDSDYGAQFGNKHASESNVSRSPMLRRKRGRSESTMEEDDGSNTRDWSRAGLMDWSEVLGTAAVKGWNEQALARTAQRCSALFGESMSFLPLFEELATSASTEPINYMPSTIPAPDVLPTKVPRSVKRPYFQPGAIRCPHADCYGHYKDFAMSYRVIEHCMRIHGYDPRSNDSDNEERTYGGVHIDGFLQPITAKQGWLGHGRSKSGGKKRKTEDAHPVNSGVATIENDEGEM